MSRRIAGLTSVVAAAALAIGCGGGRDTGAGDGDGAIDAAPDGLACDPDRPRAVAPEVLVGPAGLEDRIAGVIDAATGSIDVHMYTFTVDRIVDRLVAADRRGVPVRVILDPSQLTPSTRSRLEAELFYLADSAVRQAIVSAHGRGVAVRVLLADPSDMNDNATTADTLKAAGIPVKVMATPDVHAKLLVADGVALIGSHNMSTTSLRDNREVGVIVREGTAAMPARQRFEQDWTAATAW